MKYHMLESGMTPVSYIDIHPPRAPGPAVCRGSRFLSMSPASNEDYEWMAQTND